MDSTNLCCWCYIDQEVHPKLIKSEDSDLAAIETQPNLSVNWLRKLTSNYFAQVRLFLAPFGPFFASCFLLYHCFLVIMKVAPFDYLDSNVSFGISGWSQLNY